MRSIVLLAISLSLAACTSSVGLDKDPYYDAGFTDGCATGTARSSGTPASRPIRDRQLWDQSEAYRAGWRSGYNSCGPSNGGGERTY